MSDIVRQRAIVQASLDLPPHATDGAFERVRAQIHAEACKYLGNAPGMGPEWLEWKTRVEAFEWLLVKHLARETHGP